MLDASLVRELVEAEDLLPVIWKAMAGIWESEGKKLPSYPSQPF
ncbi:MAG: hypothetical protein OGMRLDGQ_000928 [Candidatus Fervidibacter sp.]|jgi:hypothetical protein